jgi:hypothetical protein
VVLQCSQEAAESGRVEAGRDAKASAVAEDKFERQRGWRRVVPDFEGHESERLVGGGSRGRSFAQESPPGVEGGFGELVAATEGSHGQAAALPEFKELSPVLCFTRIGWVALWHEQNLQDRVKEDYVLKVTTETRMGRAGRLRKIAAC